ncbi:hypothetical protein CANINC_003905 [Pichia inconspicua]|uniref:Intimal thickness related receptor IRP domain-containing protein n=1 Tax=Pichia inconspicua TaxID=52247 RepID=A0A4T0WYZ5_9ASCO|nr:hypothetical protein CANINC_003905 [[Candida] inconspicua]
MLPLLLSLAYVYLFLAAPALALVDYYNLENNKVLQTCAYLSTADGLVQNWFKRNDAEIIIHFPKIEGLESKVDVYTLIMGGPDMKNVQIGLNPYFKICDEITLNQGYCNHEPDDLHLKKMNLGEMIDSGSFSNPIESFMFSTDSDDHIYKIEKSGVYCTMLLTSNIPENLEKFMVEIDWKQSYGNLLISDFIRLFTSIGFAFFYSLAAILLSFLIYRRLQSEKTSISLDPFRYKKFTLQYKFILFYWSYAIVFFAISLNYIVLNKYGYNTSSPILPISNLLYLTSSTLVTVWMVYHFLIFSAGAWFNGFKNSSSKLYISRLISALLMLQMLIYDVESSSIYSLIGDGKRDLLSTGIYIEYIVIYFICIIWSILTSFSIQDKKLKKIFFLTIGLLSILFGMVIFGAYIFSATARATSIAYTIEYIFALIITALWYNVVIENNQMVLLK